MANFRASAKSEVGMKVSAKAEVRTLLERVLYPLALEQAHLAAEAHAPDQPVTSNDELRHSAAAIILSLVVLEAFINSVGISLKKINGIAFSDYEKGVGRPRCRRPNIKDKWVEITEAHTGGPTFPTGKKPFQDLTRLVKLRDYIVHHKAAGSSANVSDARARIHAKEAATAIDTVKAMISEFYNISGETIPDWIK